MSGESAAHFNPALWIGGQGKAFVGMARFSYGWNLSWLRMLEGSGSVGVISERRIVRGAESWHVVVNFNTDSSLIRLINTNAHLSA